MNSARRCDLIVSLVLYPIRFTYLIACYKIHHFLHLVIETNANAGMMMAVEQESCWRRYAP
jgi:hypothetical protein